MIRAKGYYSWGSPDTRFERFSEFGREDWRDSTFLRAPMVHHDPILTPFFTSIGLTGSFTFGAVTITAASVASAITVTGLVGSLFLGGRP